MQALRLPADVHDPSTAIGIRPSRKDTSRNRCTVISCATWAHRPPGRPLSRRATTADTVAMSRRRTRIFVFSGALIVASLGLFGGLGLPTACGLDGWDYACDPSRVGVLGIWVFRPVAVVSSIVIGALLGGVIGLILSGASNRACLATGLGVTLGSALWATLYVLTW
jgi:hypothetical protein